jgi:hypothetical protein
MSRRRFASFRVFVYTSLNEEVSKTETLHGLHFGKPNRARMRVHRSTPNDGSLKNSF